MKRFPTAALTALIAVSALSVPMAASAQARHPQAQVQVQSWQSINARQANLDRRIDQGVRNGALSRREATALRAEFRQLVQLEARYRRNGLTVAERRDLDQRFDRLSARIRIERRDRDGRRG